MVDENYYRTDEPTAEDYLGRDVYARTLQKVIQKCQTPIVIGVHGGWGSGKTSLMRLTQSLLEKEGVKTVWFNPWEHQFEEAPIIPLLHEIKDIALSYKVKTEGLKLLRVLGSLAGEVVLRTTTGGMVKSEDILKQGLAFEEKYFETKTVGQRIHKHFQKVVDAIAGKEGKLIIFIDDLDRCLPHQALRVLEAIKLFLNAKNCVYVVGVAREVIEQAIQNHYGKLEIPGQSYLDKIIQLPFNIPPIHDDKVERYLDELNPNEDIKPYYKLIHIGADRNPRNIKRFMNSLLLNDTLAHEIKIEDYKPHVPIKLLIFQLRFLDFYNYISRRPNEFSQIEKLAQKDEVNDEDIKKIPRVKEFLAMTELKEILHLEPLIKGVDLKPYIHLAERTKSEPATPPKHREIVSTREKMEAALRQGHSLAFVNLRGADLAGAILKSTDLRGADLEGAVLVRANLWGANLREANLRRVNLMDANLREATLEGATLEGADLSGADLEGADFEGADFEGAGLTLANLSGVLNFEQIKSFKNTRLITVKGLSREQLEYARSKGAIIEE